MENSGRMFDANEIAELTRKQTGDLTVSAQTVHYYVREGILPPAIGRGPGAYSSRHVNMMIAARNLKQEGLSLDQIKDKLQKMQNLTSSEIARKTPQTGLSYLSIPGGGPEYQIKLTRSITKHGPGKRQRRPSPVTVRSAKTEKATGVTRRLKFEGDWQLVCPPGATESEIADIYNTIEKALLDKRKGDRTNA